MARVALVNPGKVGCIVKLRDISNASMRRFLNSYVSMRCSLSQLSSCLKGRGHSVVLFDLPMLGGWEDYRDLIKHENPDFLGVTSLTFDHDGAVKCCEIAKKLIKIS